MNAPAVAPASNPDVYAAFSGALDATSLQRILAAAGGAVQNGFTHIHLLFQSSGGTVADGICLYNFFRTLPIKLTIYNAGNVGSIAVIAFLGAQARKASANATFMIHRTYTSPQNATARRLKTLMGSIINDDDRSEAILRQHLTLPPDKWADLDKDELFFTAQEALKMGLVDEISHFAPAPGAMLYGI